MSLADAVECLAVPAADVQELFDASNQATYFTDGDVTSQVAVKPQLPGDACTPPDTGLTVAPSNP